MNLNEFDGKKVAIMLDLLMSRELNDDEGNEVGYDMVDDNINQFTKELSFSDLHRVKQIYSMYKAKQSK